MSMETQKKPTIVNLNENTNILLRYSGRECCIEGEQGYED